MFSKLTLQRRVVLFSLVILIAGLGIFSWLGVESANDSTSRTLDERLIMARLAASRLDETLQYSLVQLQSAANSADLIQSQDKFNSVAGRLQESLINSGVSARNIISTNAGGRVLSVLPAVDGLTGSDLSVYLSVEKSLSGGGPAISGLVSLPVIEKPVVLLSVPLFAPDGKIQGALVCSVDMDQSISGSFSRTLVLGKTGYTEIVDEKGVVIARTSPGSPLQTFELSDHPGRFAALIAQGKATVGTCHRCHDSEGAVVRNKDVLAFAPLSVASWGVAVRQPEEEALAPTWELEKKLAFFGIILAACTVLVVLVMVRGIVGPIRLLTSAARKIAVGDMETAIPIQRQDEIGELSTAFQSMRQEIAKSRKEMDSRYIAARDKGETRGGLLNNVISAQEEERQRIARDLHDDSIQSLILVCRQLDTLGEETGGQEKQTEAGIKAARTTVEQTITGLRNIIKALRPPILDDLGLLASIRRILRDFQERTGIESRFEQIGEDRRLPPEIELGVFRIANEAVWNVEHHAQASAVKLSIYLSDSEIRLEVQDNGIGFAVPPSLDDFSNRGKFGVLGMRERVELLGGKLEVDSSPGKGTRVCVRVSLSSFDGEPRPK